MLLANQVMAKSKNDLICSELKKIEVLLMNVLYSIDDKIRKFAFKCQYPVLP